MKESILIVGDEVALVHAHAKLLRDWEIVMAGPRDAEEAILLRGYNLLVFGQTVRDEVAKSLIALAMDRHPERSMLAICLEEEQHLRSATHHR